MSDISNNIAILSYLKDKVHKWKNISVLLAIISFLLLVKVLIGGSFSQKIEAGNYIAEIEIEGTIFHDDYRDKALKKLSEDSSVKAVIVKINSPGGGIVASESIYMHLRKIVAKKPVVVVMQSVAASGGYMAAIASDHIIAHNGTLTGSIGVLMQSANIIGLGEKLGINFETYKSAPLKATPSPFERSSDYVKQVVQSSVEDSAQFFFEIVKERRSGKIKKSNYSKLFDGRVFTGRQALKVGLIDEIGDLDSALNHLKEKHKIDTDSVSVRKVKLIKPSNKLLQNLNAFLPFSAIENKFKSGQIMAIMPF